MNVDNIDRVIAHIEAGKEPHITYGWLNTNTCFVGIIERALGLKHERGGDNFIAETLDVHKDNASCLFLMTNSLNPYDDFWHRFYAQDRLDQIKTLVGALTSLRDDGIVHWNL